MREKMSLVESYEKIKPTIIAFTPKFHPVYNKNEPMPEFLPILGTGFIIDDGIVVTNDHVVKAIPRLPKPQDCPPDICPVNCLLWHFIPNRGLAIIPIEVLGVFGISHMEQGKNYYGPPKPDVAFVHIKMKKLPKANVKYDLKEIKEGRNVATAGFPMGTETLTAPGYLHQLTPTLQKGIISAILPFQCEMPHALMINVMVQGGASGSPVFLPESGDVIGVLYGSLEDTRSSLSALPKKYRKDIEHLDPSFHSHLFNAPTNISYVVPAHYIEKMLQGVKERTDFEFPDDTLTLEEYVNRSEHVERKRGEPAPLRLWDETEAIERTIKKESPTPRN
jgi:hypothetical protein